MRLSRNIRRCALQALYQFDVGVESEEMIRESFEHARGDEHARDTGLEVARAAWALRDDADAQVAKIAPDWPTYRQPVIDRSILRLAFYELSGRVAPPKVVINEAVELAKEFSTAKSPLFINGVLDKIYKSRFAAPAESKSTPDDADTPCESAG